MKQETNWVLAVYGLWFEWQLLFDIQWNIQGECADVQNNWTDNRHELQVQVLCSQQC